MSSGGNNNGKGAAATGVGSIPLASRKVVQSLKEIVNCPEAEIYAMLRECNMDPNETVNRLLTQDPFHEVKSKREKKKENKDTTEYKPRGGGNPTNRGGRGGTDRRTGPTHNKYSESGNPHERSANRKGNGTDSHVAPYSSTSLSADIDVIQNVSSFSDNALKENKLRTASRDDGFSSSVQPASRFHSAWGGGNVGQVSMADIVKKGIPQNKAPGPVSSAQYGKYNHVVTARAPLLPHHAMHPPHDHVLPGPESEICSTRHKDDRPAMEHTEAEASAIPLIRAVENLETPDPHHSSGSQNVKPDETPWPNGNTIENVNEHYIASATNISLQEEIAGNASYYDNNVYEDPSSYGQYGHAYQHEEAEDNRPSLSIIAANMQQLSLEKDEQAQQTEEIRSVVIPDHLQVQTSECLNLSFGSFGAGISAGLSGTTTAGPLNDDVEEQSEAGVASVASPVVLSNYRNAEYYEDERVRSTSPEDVINRSGITGETRTSVSPSQPEATKQDISSEGGQYALHNSLPGYNFDNSHQQQLNAVYAQLQTGAQIQNTTPFPNIMAYANLSPASLLASAVQQPVRESDISQFHANQLMAAKYGTTGSVGGPSASGAEVLETSNMSSSQQVLSSVNAAASGPGLPQHLAMHPYSQPTLPLGPFANMISYPFLPPSYTYMPSAFQQAFSGNSSYHQSLASVQPQYKNNLSVSSNLPQLGAVPSGYGAFGGNSANVPGNLSLNQNANAGGSSIGYDELASSQYRDHLLALQQLQNDNSAMYGHGNGTRTMSAVPANSYYNFQGQNQHPSGFRQNQQQQSQHFGSPSYPNFYHSQSGMSMEHQQQNPRDGSIGGSQVQSSKKSQQQMWQNSY